MTVQRFQDLELTTLAGDDFNEDRPLVIQPERVNVTGNGQNEGLYVYSYGRGPSFIDRKEAERLRDALVAAVRCASGAGRSGECVHGIL